MINENLQADFQRAKKFVSDHKVETAVITTAVIVHTVTKKRASREAYQTVVAQAKRWGEEAGAMEVQLGVAYDYMEAKGVMQEFCNLFEPGGVLADVPKLAA